MNEFIFRFDFYYRTGMSAYVNSIKGAYIVVHASTIRYRRSLNFLKRYNIQTRLVFYDERYSILFVEAELRYINDNPLLSISRYWNHKQFSFRSMYFEQCYVTKSSGTKLDFVNAVAMFKMTAINMNVREMMCGHFGIIELVVDAQVIYITGELHMDMNFTSTLDNYIAAIVYQYFRKNKKFSCSFKCKSYHQIGWRRWPLRK